MTLVLEVTANNKLFNKPGSCESEDLSDVVKLNIRYQRDRYWETYFSIFT